MGNQCTFLNFLMQLTVTRRPSVDIFAVSGGDEHISFPTDRLCQSSVEMRCEVGEARGSWRTPTQREMDPILSLSACQLHHISTLQCLTFQVWGTILGASRKTKPAKRHPRLFTKLHYTVPWHGIGRKWLRTGNAYITVCSMARLFGSNRRRWGAVGL